MDIEYNELFHVPLFNAVQKNQAVHQQGLMDLVTGLSEADEGIVRSNQRGWHSETDLHLNAHADMQWLRGVIRRNVNKVSEHFFSRVGGKAGSNMSQQRMVITECWANINRNGAWNAPHHHIPSVWSGCYYVSIGEMGEKHESGNNEDQWVDGEIMLFNPYVLGPPFHRKPFIRFPPKNGMMLIFPSYLLHMVAPYYPQTPRISIAFNLKAGGKRQAGTSGPQPEKERSEEPSQQRQG